jgi:prepilin-type N-terminal cleavage/methylation domain-containing protein
MTCSVRRRFGFTLVEMLAVMWALAICLGFGVALILAAIRTDQVGAATLRELSRRADLADQFRADVAAADAAPERLGEWTAGTDCLILHTPGGGHFVYRCQNGKLARIVRTGDKETRTPLSVGGEDTRVEFDRPAGDRPLVTLRVLDAPRRGIVWRSDFTAALGGDNR